MNILIIAPQYKPRGEYYELPLGLAYISSYLKREGLDVQFQNLNENKWDDAQIKWADVVCTGGLSVHYHKVRDILIRTKAANPNAITIVGGGLISSEPALMYEMLSPYINIGIVGEGEITIADLLRDMKWALSSKIIGANTIENLDYLPYPDYEGLGVKAYLDRQRCGDEYYLYPVDKPRCLPIISSRGCPHNCSFCFHPTGRVYRQRSLDNFFGEVDMLVDKYQVNMLTIMDELIAQSPERLACMCERLKKYNLKWTAQIRVDSADENTMKMMKDAGCFSLSVGIEHVNQTVLNGYNKRTTLKQIEGCLELLYKHGVGIQGNILLGGPDETPSTMNEAIQWRDTHSKYMINLTAVIPYPGTELFKRGVDEGKIRPKIFISQECPYINFTGTQLELPFDFMWTDKVRFENGILTATCPHCNWTQEYPGLYWGGTGAAFTHSQSYRLGCRNCNQRFDFKWRFE